MAHIRPYNMMLYIIYYMEGEFLATSSRQRRMEVFPEEGQSPQGALAPLMKKEVSCRV
jgi:hypothetical protein